MDCFPCVRLSARIALLDNAAGSTNVGGVVRFIRRRYAPFLLRPFVKSIVLLFFTGLFVGSVISIQHIQLGLGEEQIHCH